MTNPKLAVLLREAVVDNHKEKICLIEDVIKAKKLLFGLGQEQHNEFLIPVTIAAALFDELYELDICALQIVYKEYEKQINKLMHEKTR